MFGKSKNIKVNLDRLTPASPVAAEDFKHPRTKLRAATWNQCTICTTEQYAFSAILLDYTETGARVRFRSHDILPAQVELKVAALGMSAKAEVVWQDKGDAGLRFI